MYFILKRAYRYNNSSIETLHTLPHLYPSVSNTTSWASPNQNSFQATIQWVNKWPCHSNIKTHQESLGKKIQSLQCCHETKSWVQWNMGKSNWETQLGAFSNCFMILNSSNLDWFRWHVKYWWTISCTSWYGKYMKISPSSAEWWCVLILIIPTWFLSRFLFQGHLYYSSPPWTNS